MNARLKKFVSYYKPYRKLFIAELLCAVVAASASLLFPLFVRYITKNVLQEGVSDAIRQFIPLGIAMVALVLLQAACTYFYDYKGHTMGAMMESDLRAELFSHLQTQSFGFFEDRKVGQLMSRITNDLLSLTELYHHGPEDLVIYTVKFVGALVILIHTSANLTLSILLFLPVMAIYTHFFGKKMYKAYQTNYDRIGEVNAQVEENLSGIRVVQSFTNEDIERQKFAKENRHFLESRKAIYRNESYLYTGIIALTQLMTIAVVLFGGVSIVRGTIDLADLITFLLYVGYLIEPIPRLAHITRQYQEGIAAFNRFMDILEIQPGIQDSPNAMDLSSVQGEIRFENVAFRYHEETDDVLKGISLTVKAGEYVALVGSSGVGKTTLCSLIPRFYEVSEGSIYLDGIPLKDIRLSSLRKAIGVVQQDTYLYAGTIRDNIRYGNLQATDDEIIVAAKQANAHDFIMALPQGYDTDIGQRGIKLSGGQKQRMSIARVFLKNPPILILDEATSALDNESESVIRDSLESLAQNRTTFVIAHRLSTIRNAQRIIVLSDSGIDEQGTHDELIARDGLYARLYQLQGFV